MHLQISIFPWGGGRVDSQGCSASCRSRLGVEAGVRAFYRATRERRVAQNQRACLGAGATKRRCTGDTYQTQFTTGASSSADWTATGVAASDVAIDESGFRPDANRPHPADTGWNRRTAFNIALPRGARMQGLGESMRQVSWGGLPLNSPFQAFEYCDVRCLRGARRTWCLPPTRTQKHRRRRHSLDSGRSLPG